MTDETGILQHAIFTVPNYREGYTTDDNARALMVSTLLEELGSGKAFDLTSRYLAFVWYAFSAETGRVRNFLDYQRRWMEESGSDDCHGRTLWALGTVVGRSVTPAIRSGMVGRLFEKALPGILHTTSPRAWAFALLGIHEYLRRFAGDLSPFGKPRVPYDDVRRKGSIPEVFSRNNVAVCESPLQIQTFLKVF